MLGSKEIPCICSLGACITTSDSIMPISIAALKAAGVDCSAVESKLTLISKLHVRSHAMRPLATPV